MQSTTFIPLSHHQLLNYIETNQQLQNSTYFITDQCIFGNYPTSTDIHILHGLGIQHIINLTCKHENLPLYINKEYNINYINFEINDNATPQNDYNYYSFIARIYYWVKKKEKIYIHCKAGHGRVGIIVSTILKLYYDNYKGIRFNVNDAISLTSLLHSKRKSLKIYRQKHKCPNNILQRMFVFKSFKPCLIISPKIDDYLSKFGLSFNIFDFKILKRIICIFFFIFIRDFIEYLECTNKSNHYIHNILESGLNPIHYISNITTNPILICIWEKTENNGYNLIGKILFEIKMLYYQKINIVHHNHNHV